MPRHDHTHSTTSGKHKKDAHGVRGSYGGGSEVHGVLKKHKVKSVTSEMPYEGQPGSSYGTTYAPAPRQPPKARKTVHWEDEQYVEPAQYAPPEQFMAENPYMADGAYTAPEEYYTPHKWDPTNEKQDPVKFALDAMAYGPSPVSEDMATYEYPISHAPHYPPPRPARASAGYSSSYGKRPPGNRYADELGEKRKKRHGQ